LISNISFGHNLCFKCSNGSCKLISDIYILRDFQWYKECPNPLIFYLYNCSLKIRKSIWDSNSHHNKSCPSTPNDFTGFWVNTLFIVNGDQCRSSEFTGLVNEDYWTTPTFCGNVPVWEFIWECESSFGSVRVHSGVWEFIRECESSFPHTILHSWEHEMWLLGFPLGPHPCKPLPWLQP
jgi:hypothetical protein